MHELIHDSRSGNKLEIVIPTYNEEKRIGNILEYYSDDFDIVLLDDSSSDKTKELAIRSGATIYKRIINEAGESNFIYYANNQTKSGYCFYMFSDEFVDKNELLIAYNKLKLGNSVIFGRRIDHAFGFQATSPIGAHPRGFSKGMAVYNPNELHNSLHYKKEPGASVLETYLDVHHLHIIGIARDFGKSGHYNSIEVRQMVNYRRPLLEFIKRFLIRRQIVMVKMIWKFRKSNFVFMIRIMLDTWCTTLLAIMSLIDRKYLLNEEQQYESYRNFYKIHMDQKSENKF